MSDSVRPHRRQPNRLPHPWDSPGKNTGVGCHFPLQCMKVKSESEGAQSCPTLLDPMDCSPPSSSFHGSFQARELEWGAIAFSILLCNLGQIVFLSLSYLCVLTCKVKSRVILWGHAPEVKGLSLGDRVKDPFHFLPLTYLYFRIFLPKINIYYFCDFKRFCCLQKKLFMLSVNMWQNFSFCEYLENCKQGNENGVKKDARFSL